MGRQLERTDSDIEFQRYHPGCMWGILHLRNHGKKALPRRKRGRGNVAICCKYPKTDSLVDYVDQVQEHSNADGVPLLVEQDIVEANATNRTSEKARMKALIAKEMSGRLGLQALELSRHFGSSRDELSGTKTDWGNPIIILQRTADSDANKLHVQSPRTILQQRLSSEKSNKVRACPQDAQSSNREISCSQSKDCVNVLEIFQVNQKLFLEILHDPEVHRVQKLPIQQSFIPKGRLKKSESFPAVKSSHTRSIKPSTLEHKQMEIWSVAKVENAPIVAQSPRFLAPNPTKNTATISKSVEVKDADSEDAADTQQPYFYFPAWSQGSCKHWWHPSLTSYLVGIKKKVKKAFKHNKKGNGNTIADGITSEVPSESKPSNSEKDESLRGISSSNHDLGKVSLPRIRRVSSLTLSESMDRYTQLFEHSFSKDAPRHQYHSKSLRLTAEDRSLSRGYSLKTYRRRLSMPDLDSFLPFPEEASNDDLKSEMPNRTIASSDTSVAQEIHAEFQQEIVDASGKMPEHPYCERNNEIGGDISENKDNSSNLLADVDERIAEAVDLSEEQAETHQDEQLASTTNSIKEDEDLSPISVLKTRFRDDISRQPDFPVSEGSGLGACSIYVTEPEASSGLIESSSEDSAVECNKERAAKAMSTANAHFHISNFNRQDDADLDYVKDVLDISGFLDQECRATWYSLDQPLSPYLFKELETYLHPEERYHQEDLSYDNNHHILFDLVNEALLELFDTSLAYFPKQFSFAQSVRPIPKGNHILEEVWKRIIRHQTSGSRKDQSLNDIVVRDMTKGDGWMNLLLDAEDVALDLEDVIFDELLDEALDLSDNCV